MSLIPCHECSKRVSGHVRTWFFVLFLFVAINVIGQPVAPTWLGQVKLSAINGLPDHPLAVINDQTFAPGEEGDLKLKGRTVHLRCLEIHEQSVLAQIQGVPSPCELTYSGILLPMKNRSSVASTPQPATTVEPPALVTPINLFVPTVPASQPPDIGKSGSSKTLWYLSGIFLVLFLGVTIGAGGARWQYRKNIGEAMLADTIGRVFSRPHLLLNNVTLPTTGGTTQIDHVLVADTGIFVIETKHYSGWIFGNPKDSQWTQSIYRHKSRFQNPLRQNYAHIVALQGLFDLPENNFYSVVVFTGDAEFKSDLGGNVVKLAGLIPFLTAERPAVFDERKMAYVVGRIEMKRNRRSLETDEYHINHIRNRLAGRKSKLGSETIFPSSASHPVASSDEKYQPKA